MGSQNLSSSALTSLIMKFLVLAVSLSICSAQGFFGLVGHPNGAITPIDEPAVAAARAEHLAAKGALYAAAPVAVASPLSYAAVPAAYAPAAYAPAYGYSGPLNFNTQLIAHPNGAVVPVDEPAVAAARAEHLNTQGALFAAQTPVVTAPVAAYAAAPVAAYSAAPAVAYAAAPAAYAPNYGYTGPSSCRCCCLPCCPCCLRCCPCFLYWPCRSPQWRCCPHRHPRCCCRSC